MSHSREEVYTNVLGGKVGSTPVAFNLFIVSGV